jgi:hypothetical protein
MVETVKDTFAALMGEFQVPCCGVPEANQASYSLLNSQIFLKLFALRDFNFD